MIFRVVRLVTVTSSLKSHPLAMGISGKEKKSRHHVSLRREVVSQDASFTTAAVQNTLPPAKLSNTLSPKKLNSPTFHQEANLKILHRTTNRTTNTPFVAALSSALPADAASRRRVAGKPRRRKSSGPRAKSRCHPQLQVLHRTVSGTERQVNSHHEWIDFECQGSNQVLDYVKSVHYGGSREDRDWTFSCGALESAMANDLEVYDKQWTELSDYDAHWTKGFPHRVITGFKGHWWNNGRKDRMFRIETAGLRRRGRRFLRRRGRSGDSDSGLRRYAADQDSDWQNAMDGKLEKRFGEQDFPTHVESRHSNHHEDRQWKFRWTRYCVEKEACRLGPWGSWGACTCSSQGGNSAATETRTRSIQGDADVCIHNAESEPLTETRTCVSTSCACAYGVWSDWGECSVSCGAEGGERKRTRSVTSTGDFGPSSNCGLSENVEETDANPCNQGVACPTTSSTTTSTSPSSENNSTMEESRSAGGEGPVARVGTAALLVGGAVLLGLGAYCSMSESDD